MTAGAITRTSQALTLAESLNRVRKEAGMSILSFAVLIFLDLPLKFSGWRSA